MKAHANLLFVPLLASLFLLLAVLGPIGCGAGPSGGAATAEGGSLDTAPPPTASARPRASGVCPPFKLRDERGDVIDPVHGVNDAAPYSPKQTCGASGCHDYARITEGFHFTQGKGEAPPPVFAERYRWVSSPGNYGGTWCSPAPLYRQLAPKRSSSARTIDMTSFEFVTATCGNCHPGGGPLEYDRDGRRYDERMRDPASGLVAGGENGLDGDYYKARWSETGVIEADCLLCHMPEYSYGKRNAELASLNFRWAASAGAGLAAVTGKVAAGEAPLVSYNRERFDADGNVVLHVVPEPRNETCLNCHAKPDWKKRGASYTPRTDVHMAAGLRCVDCHAAGSRAADPRTRTREEHQLGKGDDPSGHVRDDLDGTVRSCEACHIDGWRNAPRAAHAWLPPFHMEKIACQTCHIPYRAVKSALVQASDVYNPAPRITPPAKHIWTFYDQDMAFWNHYGELELFTAKDEPTNISRPTLIRYKGKIFPANRVHSAFVGFEEKGKPGLNQLFMKDFFQMWTQHRADPEKKYPELAQITDDNEDGILEVNRPEEIDALLAATRAHLAATGFPLEGRRLVWVSDSRAHYSSVESRDLPREEHEATAYASVYKFSHDVAPARSALGAGGCTDCHSFDAPFFMGRVLERPFAACRKPEWVPNHTILGLSTFWVRLGALREQWLKPLLYALMAASAALLAALGLREALSRQLGLARRRAAVAAGAFLVACALGGALVAYSPDLLPFMGARRFTLDANHFAVAVAVGAGAVAVSALHPKGATGRGRLQATLARLTWALAGFCACCGALMLLRLGAAEKLTRLAYTGFDLGLLGLAAATVAGLAAVLFQSAARVPAGGAGGRGDGAA